MDLNSEPRRIISAPTDIKTMVADGNLLYVGTSNGKVVSIPVRALRSESVQDWCIISHGSLEERGGGEKETKTDHLSEVRDDKKGKTSKEKKRRHSKEAHEGKRGQEEPKKGGGGGGGGKRSPKEPAQVERKPEERGGGKESPNLARIKEEAKAREAALLEMRGHSLSHCAVSVHSHLDERVRDLLFLRLPEMKLSKLKQAAEMMQYHSLPNLASPLGGRIPVSPPILSFRSLVISVGRGHVEYVEDKGEEPGEESGRYRESHEAFQLLVWGHKNVATS